MTNEDSVLEEAMDNLREAGQRIRATQNVMHAQGMTRRIEGREKGTRPPLLRGGILHPTMGMAPFSLPPRPPPMARLL